MAESATIVLADDYYLVNFRHLLGFVSEAYGDLLSESELRYAATLESLPTPALRLYIRLLCRSKTTFRLDKLSYAEIGPLDKPVQELSEHGLLDIDPVLDLAEALLLFTKPEILDALSNTPEALQISVSDLRKLKRPALEQCALESFENAESLVVGYRIVRTLDEVLFDTFKLCFFGNLYQDMTEYVLRDLGLTRFENYSIDPDTRAFASREQIEAHLDYYRVAAMTDELEPGDVQAGLDLSNALPEAHDPALKRRVERLRNHLARNFEREGFLPEALDLYQRSSRPPSRERRARILAGQGHAEDALKLCADILENPFDEEEVQTIKVFAPRVAKKHQLQWPANTPYKPIEKTVTLLNDERNVELQAADWYAGQGKCFYTENTLCTGVFGLAFWDIIFAPVSGVFYNPFQSAPADFYEPEFYRLRAPLIQRARETFESDPELLARQVKARWQEKFGIQNTMIHWKYLTEELLENALLRISWDDWSVIFDRLLGDLRHNRSGFPDLVLFPEAGGYEFIEIKGPGDTLQKNQIRWMEYFKAHDIAHHVCHVKWVDEQEVPESQVAESIE